MNLYQLILEDPILMANLEPTEELFDELLNLDKKGRVTRALRRRYVEIETALHDAVTTQTSLTGAEAFVLMEDYHKILIGLQDSFETIVNLWCPGNSFASLLRSHAFIATNYPLRKCTVLGKRCDYLRESEMLALTMAEREVPVILDGNRVEHLINGKRAQISTLIRNNEVALDKCHDLIRKLAALGCYPEELEFLLSVYADTDCEEDHFPVLEKTVIYIRKTDSFFGY